MKRNRMMIKRRRRNANLFLIVLFCLILPISAIYIGLRITEIWISPALNSEDSMPVVELGEDTEENSKTKEDDSNESKINSNENTIKDEINGLSIYTIQIASLSDNTNLEDLIGELNRHRFPHLVHQVDNSFKVYVKGGTHRDHVEVELAHVREYYPDAYINDIHLGTTKIAYEEGEDEAVYKEIAGDLNEILLLLEKQGESWYNFHKKEGDLDGYIELLKKQQSVLSQLSNNLSDVELNDSFPEKSLLDKMIVYQEENITRSIEMYEESQSENAHRLHSLYLDNLFKTLEVIKG